MQDTAVVPQYLVPDCSGTRDKCQSQVRNDDAFSLAGPHRDSLESSKCSESQASTESSDFFFSCQNATSTGFDAF